MSAGGGVEDMCVLCKRTHASRRAPESITKALPFFIFCRAHAGYVLVLTHWPGLDTYGSSPAYHKLAHLLSEACVDLCFKRDSLSPWPTRLLGNLVGEDGD